jgi:hypothetical protein
VEHQVNDDKKHHDSDDVPGIQGFPSWTSVLGKPFMDVSGREYCPSSFIIDAVPDIVIATRPPTGSAVQAAFGWPRENQPRPIALTFSAASDISPTACLAHGITVPAAFWTLRSPPLSAPCSPPKNVSTRCRRTSPFCGSRK